MMKIDSHKEAYLHYFDHYPVFQLYISYAFKYRNYDLYVDDLIHPKTLIMYVDPAFILYGQTNHLLADSIKNIITKGSWIISPDESWDSYLTDLYKDHIQSFPRLLCDGKELNIEHLKSLQKPLPEELSIVPIEQKHLTEGMIKDQILDKFFQNIDFMSHGYGLALVNHQGVIHGYALTNYPIDNEKEIEVSYRVGYDDYQVYRNRGIGTTLVSRFLEETLHKGYIPIWDAANQISQHIAHKLGYEDHYHWFMHHII